MEKTIAIDGKAVQMRATAAVPRLYRIKFGRDIMQDIMALKRAYERVSLPEGSSEDDQNTAHFSVTDLTLFENVAYIMAKHADPEGTPGTSEEWLEQFETFSIYFILPEILGLWMLNEQSISESKKKLAAVAAR